MVLERIISFKHGRKKPLTIFFFSLLVSLIAIFIAYTVFKEFTGLFTVVIISLVMVPFMNSMLRHEERETVKTGEHQGFFERHGDVVMAYASLFAGMVIAMSFVFVLLPQGTVEMIFNEQINEVNIIQGRFTFGSQFLDILINNVSVLILSFIFSFLLGTGAILILAWNASVLSAAIGLLAKSLGGLKGIPIAILTFFPHGSFELTAYFIGAIAGGLVSSALMKKKSVKFWFIISDSSGLLFISFICLLIGAFIETLIIIA